MLFEDEKIWVELVQPINSATAIGTHIQKYGTGLYEATLLGNEAIESLPVAARHRAKLRVSSAWMAFPSIRPEGPHQEGWMSKAKKSRGA